ncbi:hypothetical protein pb186bvf_005798 [Paramecium bursaria]
MMGLHNVGNSCYMNSVLQMLYNNQPFMNDVEQAFQNKDNSYLISIYFIQIYYDMREGMCNPDNLLELRNCVKNRFPHFNSQQQDAQEFLNILLDLLHEELRKPDLPQYKLQEFKKDDLDTTVAELISFLEFEASPIVKHFSNIVQVQYKCLSCFNLVLSLEIQNSILLNLINQACSLVDLVIHNFKDEEVKKECSKCKQNKQLKQTRIIKLAKNIIFSINRYKKQNLLMQYLSGDLITKNLVQISLPLFFTLNKKPLHISGMIDHLGDYNKGHYKQRLMDFIE